MSHGLLSQNLQESADGQPAEKAEEEDRNWLELPRSSIFAPLAHMKFK